MEGIPESEFSKTSSFILLILGALTSWRGYYLFGTHILGTPDSMQWLLPSVILLMGIGMILAGAIDLIRILTGSKRIKYEHLYEESRKRMSDESYIQALKALGYLR